MNIAEVIPKDNHTLYIRAEDGRADLFDVRPYLESEAFAPLKDKTEFERVRNGGYFIEWNCGADLSADTIQAHWTTTETRRSGQGFGPATRHPDQTCRVTLR